MPLFDVQTLEERFRRHVGTERLVARLLVPLGGAGISLAAFGVFALITHQVASRRRELALRMALDATGPQIFAATTGDGLVVCSTVPAVWLPARRAAMLDPVEALRET